MTSFQRGTKGTRVQRIFPSTLVILIIIVSFAISNCDAARFRCPTEWLEYGGNCYNFIRSPKRNAEQARAECAQYNAYLLSVISLEEHQFVANWLRQNDPLHAGWYTSAYDAGNNAWRWQVPPSAVNTFGATSPLLNSFSGPGGSGGSGSAGGPSTTDIAAEFGLGRSSSSDFYSILAQLWLPLGELQEIETRKRDKERQLQQRLLPNELDASRGSFGGSGPAYGEFDSQNARHAYYNFSQPLNRWGLLRVNGNEYHSYVCKMRLQDVNFAIAMERNIDYGIHVLNPEKIPRGPKFTHEPDSVVFDVSGRAQLNYATLKCVADAYPMPTYKWFKEEYLGNVVRDQEIDPLSDRRLTQTDGILTIDNPQADKDRGKYHCMAENRYGVIVSKTVQLSFGYIGEFTKKRSPDFGREFWGKSISCDPPKHHPGVSYHWSRNSFEYIVEDDRRMFVSRDGSLYFSSLEKIDRANYSCNVKSSIASSGRTGPFFPLIVDSASNSQKLLFPSHFPKIFPEIKLAGTEIRLECMAYGYPVPYYNWTRSGITDRMPDGSYLTSYARVLIIPNAKVEDSGEYNCTATSGKDVITKAVSLVIQSLPIILRPIGNKVVERNLGLLRWECEAYGNPAVSYAWFRNGVEISDRNKAIAFSEEDRNRFETRDNVLLIHGLIPERDEGMYQCRAANELGTAFSAGQLRVVQMAPSFAKYPMPPEIWAGEGGNITIPCVPEALPKASFEWQKDFGRLSTGGRVRMLGNGFLHISPVAAGDAGQYSCVARNSLGTDRTRSILRVFSRPKMYVRPDPVYERRVGETLELPCQAFADPRLDVAYHWKHNGLRIDFTKPFNYKYSTPDIERGDMRVWNLTLAETGDYECIARTVVGVTSAATRVVLYAPPGATGSVVADDIGSTTARVHWIDGPDNGRRILGYNIEGITNHDEHWRSLLNSSEFSNRFESLGRRRMVYLRDLLTPWSTYRFRVSAWNEIGAGPPSEPSPSYNTERTVPFKAPRNVGGGGGKVGTLTITWDPLPPQDWNAPDVWYRVFYKLEELMDHPYIDHNLTALGNVNMYAVDVGEENYYKRYLVRVQAMNSMGAGLTASEPVIVYSAESMPSMAPTHVYATAHNGTALNVTWSPIGSSREHARGKLIGHRIKYWKPSQDPQTEALLLLRRDPEQTWGLIVGLFPDTEYYIAVMGFNEAGAGPESEPFLARTYKAAPQQPPTSVNLTAIDSRTMMVRWRGIASFTAAEEPIIGYKVRYWDSDQPITRAMEVIKYLDGGPLQAIITDLVQGKTYKVRVLAFSNGGDGKMSSQIEFKIEPSGVLTTSTAFNGASLGLGSYVIASAPPSPQATPTVTILIATMIFAALSARYQRFSLFA